MERAPHGHTGFFSTGERERRESRALLAARYRNHNTINHITATAFFYLRSDRTSPPTDLFSVTSSSSRSFSHRYRFRITFLLEKRYLSTPRARPRLAHFIYHIRSLSDLHWRPISDTRHHSYLTTCYTWPSLIPAVALSHPSVTHVAHLP